MAITDLIMPKMGESVAEATVIKWLKNEGDRIEMDEPVLEIATDKVDSEVPSPVEGILVKKLFNEEDVVQVGEAIAQIETGGAVAASASPSAASPAASTPTSGSSPAPSSPAAAPSAVPSAVPSAEQTISDSMDAAVATAAPIAAHSGDRFYSPLVRNIAQVEGISAAELDTIPGTGKEGRVTKKDMLAYVAQRSKDGPAPATTPAKTNASTAAPASTPASASAGTGTSATSNLHRPPVQVGAGDEIIEMDRMRKLIADHMVMSKHVSPHVTSFVEADVTRMVRWREAHKNAFAAKTGEKITFTPLIIEAVIRAIQDFPDINISVEGTQIIKRKNINIGMAAALPSGNLIVPVIHNADELNLVGLTKRVNDLANRARNNQLKPDEIQGGTYTLTNVGTFGNVMGTPIINQPQVAIMAAGAIRKKPAVIETPEGDTIAIRHMMFLSHSYDHRVVDGALGGMFVRRVADYLEQFDDQRSY